MTIHFQNEGEGRGVIYEHAYVLGIVGYAFG